MASKLAPHEALELHELMDCEISVVKKLKASLPMVQDNELKEFMENRIRNKSQQIDEMIQFAKSQGIE
ncbi:MAG: hypothetical protein Q8936_00025 [Bacillota bacterium]|nr:hypothetical protein [Bacillota bacterium]